MSLTSEHIVYFFFLFSLTPSRYLSDIPAQLCRGSVTRCDGKGGIVGEDQKAKRGAKDTGAD